MENKNLVCAIVVTYNRKELLFRNIKSLLNQKSNIDILIIDNASTDKTYDFLKENGIIDLDVVTYRCLKENSGGAGGFYAGLKHAYKMGYQLFWLMDDDGYALHDLCFENILTGLKKAQEESGSKMIIANSLIVQEDLERLTFGLDGYKNKKELVEKGEGNLYYDAVNPFNATLITRDIVEKIGLVRRDFFIGGDEVEYIERLKKHGGKVVTVLNSFYYHPVPSFTYVDRFGKKVMVSREPIWKIYYRTRNMVWVSRKYFTKKRAFMYFFRKYISTLLFEDMQKKEKLKMLGLAYRDGIAGDFSNNNIHLNRN